MIKDDEIKTLVSPFAMKDGEIKQFDGKDRYVSMNQIVGKINRGHFKELEYEILKIVNEYEFITSRQIAQLLKLKGYVIDNPRKLNRKLEQLLEIKVLSRYYFGSLEGVSSYRVYCLEKNGKNLLEAKDIPVTWRATDNTKTVGVIKRRLAANQVIISFKEKAKYLKSSEAKHLITSQVTSNSIKSNGLINLGYEDLNISVIIESVRREENWIEILNRRMSIYKDFFDYFKAGDSKINNLPYLLIVCEDKKHIVEVYKEMLLRKFRFPKTVYFTYDLLQLEPTLNKTWFEFKISEDDVKLEMVDVDILK